MNEESKKIFDEIKKKAQADKEIWNASEEDKTISMASKEADEIMERMFLVYYTNQYLILKEENENLQKLVKIKESHEQQAEKMFALVEKELSDYRQAFEASQLAGVRFPKGVIR